MEFLSIAKLLFDEAATTTQTADGASSNIILILFKVVIAVYLFVAAIRGKGKLIENEYPKCNPKLYKLILRLISTFSGLAILANGVFEFLAGSVYGEGLGLSAEQFSTLGTVLWAIGLAGLVALIVVNVVLTDRKAMEAARKEEETNRRAGNHGDPLHAAFVFDDEDEKNAEGNDGEKKNDDQDGQN